jgi:hypothetical protein
MMSMNPAMLDSTSSIGTNWNVPPELDAFVAASSANTTSASSTADLGTGVGSTAASQLGGTATAAAASAAGSTKSTSGAGESLRVGDTASEAETRTGTDESVDRIKAPAGMMGLAGLAVAVML